MNLKLKQILRLFRKIATWPYDEQNSPYQEKLSHYQYRREMFMSRMWQSSGPISLNLCSLAVYYLNAQEECDEILSRPIGYYEEKQIQQFHKDLESRIGILDLATDPEAGIIVPTSTLEKWQWDDDLRLALDFPNEQYQQAHSCINETLQLINSPA